jgi:hypothetical protein
MEIMMSGTMAGDYNLNQNATLGNGGLQQFGGNIQQAQWNQRNAAFAFAAASAVGSEYIIAPSARFRALRLLWKHLTHAQRAQYKLFAKDIDHEGHSFIVTGNTTGHHYRIFETGSVLRLRDQHRFCLVLTGEPVPPADMMLAKKLLLENDERLFLYTANDLTDGTHGRALEDQLRRAWIARPPAPPPPPTTTGRRGRAFLNRIRLRQW